MAGKKNTAESDFEKLLDQYDYKFKKGDLVKGYVIGFDSYGVLVDIGAKTTALVPTYEAVEKGENIEDKFEKGQEYEFLIIKEEDEDGRFLISKKKVDFAYAWKDLEKAKESDAIILGTIANIVKGGILVDVAGVRGFIPSSQLRVKETELEVGAKIEVKILTLDAGQNNFILSNKKVYDDNVEESRKSVFSQIEVGQVVSGEVVRITDFGAFVDIGGVDGLLPLSQLSWKWIDHPTDVLHVGDKINVEVIAIDQDKQRISLSLKKLEQDPWEEAQNHIKEGDKIEGNVTRLKYFGAFVEVYPGVEALLPHDEVVEYQNEKEVIIQVGDKIETYIIKFNPSDRRIALSIHEQFTNEIDTSTKENAE